MAATAELPRPGVEVIQTFQTASPTILTPTLVPFVTGAAKEIIEVTTADGTLNTKAKQSTYGQLPRVISQSAFPSPRNNIAEVNVEEATIKAFLLFGGKLLQLHRDPGESFLIAWNNAYRPTVRTLAVTPAGLALDGKILILAINVAASLNTTEDVVVTFAGATPLTFLTAENIADQINLAVGTDVATVVDTAAPFVLGNKFVYISSLRFGAAASVTVRGGGSANTILGFPGVSEVRVEGSGFRAQDLGNNTTLSPWIEWSKGTFLIAGVKQTVFPPNLDSSYYPGFMQTADSSSISLPVAVDIVDFTGTTIDLKVGDQFFGDGVAPSSAFAMKVEAKRFKLGTLNLALSVFDANGNVTTAVYDAAPQSTLLGASPYAPRHAWFQAHNLNGNPAAVAAELTGSITGQPAELATVMSSSDISGSLPLALAGLTLKTVTTVDGVEGDELTYVFTGGPFALVQDIADAINTSGIFPDLLATEGTGPDTGKVVISTIRTGANQAVSVKKTGTVNTALDFSTVSDTSDTGKDIEFIDIAALLLTSGQAAITADMVGLTLDVEFSVDGGTIFTPRTHTFPVASTFNPSQIAADLNSDVGFIGGLPDFTAEAVGPELFLKTTATGEDVIFRILGTSTALGGTFLSFFGGQTDQGEENIQGHILKFTLNNRPHIYETLFLTDSLVDAIAAINETVGFPVASAGGPLLDQLVLTSTLKGYASNIRVIVEAPGSESERASFAFGFGVTNRLDFGDERPNPDFSLDITGSVVIGPEILRNQVNGQPFDPGAADIYIQYTGLRLDVSPSAVNPGLLSIGDTAVLEEVLGPLTSNNPLGLGMFFELINAPGLACTGLGVDEISGEHPLGTALAFSKVCNFIESQEVYAIAPLTQDSTIIGIFNTHAAFMSGPEQKGERIIIASLPVPTRAIDNTVASGLSASTTATPGQLTLDVNPSAALLTNGINPLLPIPVSANLFVEVSVSGVLRRYNVNVSNGVLLGLNTTFVGLENADGFFTTTPLTETLVNADWALKIRGAVLTIPGSDKPDKDLVAATVAEQNNTYKNRRFYSVFPDKVKATIGGPEEILPAFYACAAITGMVAAFPPQQGFTNLPMTGFTGVVGSNDTFSNKQLNIMAGGGTYILVQDVEGAPVISRHQLSTNITTIETRELSITKVVDFTAKFLRIGLRNFIGTFNITQPFLDSLSTVIHGMLKFLEEAGVIISGDLNNLIQSKEQPDTVLVDVTLNVPFPCNYIRLTIAV